MGRCAGINNTTGSNNNFFGFGVGGYNTTGSQNNFLGDFAGARNSTGTHNNFLGYCVGYCNSTGSYNNFLGRHAGRFSTGCSNNFFGLSAGTNNISGSNNTIIGNSANVATDALSGVIVLGTNATAQLNNELAIGSSTWPLSTVSDVTLTGQVSSVILRLNGSLFRVPIIPV